MTMSTIRLRSPADLLAVIPHVLGFHPTRSVVLIALRRRRIGLTERLDLPPPDEAAAVAERMIEPLLRDDPDAALLVAYEDEPGDGLPILEQLTDTLTGVGVTVLDRIVVRDGRRLSLDCTGGECCPLQGSALPSTVEAAHVVAEFVGEGVVPRVIGHQWRDGHGKEGERYLECKRCGRIEPQPDFRQMA